MSLTGWSKGWQRGWGSRTGRAAMCCAWVLRPGSSFPTRKTLLWDPQTNWSFFSCPGLVPGSACCRWKSTMRWLSSPSSLCVVSLKSNFLCSRKSNQGSRKKRNSSQFHCTSSHKLCHELNRLQMLQNRQNMLSFSSPMHGNWRNGLSFKGWSHTALGSGKCGSFCHGYFHTLCSFSYHIYMPYHLMYLVPFRNLKNTGLICRG